MRGQALPESPSFCIKVELLEYATRTSHLQPAKRIRQAMEVGNHHLGPVPVDAVLHGSAKQEGRAPLLKLALHFP